MVVFASPYLDSLEQIRKTEYPQLQHGETCYLDHAGTTLYAASLIKAHSEDLLQNLYGNPHTSSPSSHATTARIDHVRNYLLQELFHDKDSLYELVFTSGCSASIALVAELFQDAYGSQWHYQYSLDSHTSLVGLRGRAATWEAFPTAHGPSSSSSFNSTAPTLITWPGRSNATGAFAGQSLPPRVPQISTADQYTLYDVSALVSTMPLYLDHDSPDFVCLSFYKIFGFPTGIGALLLKKSAKVDVLLEKRKRFAGGTVEAVSATSDFSVMHAPHNGYHQILESGTLPFLSILALKAASEIHMRLFTSFEAIHQHVAYISRVAVQKLTDICHSNGCKLVKLHDTEAGSPVIAMTLWRRDGSNIGYADVQAAASVLGIHIRTGTLCNPGVTETLCGISPSELQKNHAEGHICSDNRDVLNDTPTGVIRISFGAMTNLQDIERWVSFLVGYFREEELAVRQTAPGLHDLAQPMSITLSKIVVYPVKSCAGFCVPADIPWHVTGTGLDFDRRWSIVSLTTHRVLSQKQHTKMALIRPTIDLARQILSISLGDDEFQVGLRVQESETTETTNIKVCGDITAASIYNDPGIADILSKFLGVRCTLSVLSDATTSRHVKVDPLQSWSALERHSLIDRKLSVLFSNESPFLGINTASVDAVAALCVPETFQSAVFRANFEFNGTLEYAFSEDQWTHLSIGDCHFCVLGKCRRCQMICIDQNTGVKSKEPWQALYKTRQSRGKIWFGIHMALLDGQCIKAGDAVTAWS